MAGQVGFKSESVYGTAVTVDQFVPVNTANLSVEEGWMRPTGIRGGRRVQPPAVLGARVVSGSVEMELPAVSIATLLKHYFGAVVTSGSGPYTHTYTPGAMLGDSLTLQVGITDASDTVRPFTAEGVKVTGWSISANVGEFAKTSFEWVGEDVVTATALASASYASGVSVPFTFVQGSITVNGSATKVRSARLTAAKNMRTDRHVLGSRVILEPLEEGLWTFATEISADFHDLTLYALQVAGTAVASVLTFNNGTNTLTITDRKSVV